MSSKAAPLAEREHVVYRFYDAAGGLLYVGMTSDLPGRLRSHACDKPWWATVAEIKSKSYPDQDAASAAELLAIVSERPLYNKAMNYGDIRTALLQSDRRKLHRVAAAVGVGGWLFIIWTTLAGAAIATLAVIFGTAATDTDSQILGVWIMTTFIIGMNWDDMGPSIKRLVRA